MEVKIKTPRGYKVVGRFTKGVYTKPVSWRKHYVVFCGGWGFDKVLISKLKERGCNRIVLKEKDNGKTYAIDFSTLEKYGVEKSLGNGYGLQVFISHTHFVDLNSKQGKLPL